jgi:hypothetical protein
MKTSKLALAGFILAAGLCSLTRVEAAALIGPAALKVHTAQNSSILNKAYYHHYRQHRRYDRRYTRRNYRRQYY